MLGHSLSIGLGAMMAWGDYKAAKKEGYSHNIAALKAVGNFAGWALYPKFMEGMIAMDLAPMATEAYLSSGNSRYAYVRDHLTPYNTRFNDSQEQQEYRNQGLQSLNNSISGVAPSTHPNMAKYMTRRMRG